MHGIRIEMLPECTMRFFDVWSLFLEEITLAEADADWMGWSGDVRNSSTALPLITFAFILR